MQDPPPADTSNFYDFEETYDGLGDALDETNDDLNDETFGEDVANDKDFDFAGNTANVQNTLDQEHLTYARMASGNKKKPVLEQQPSAWKKPVPDLQPMASLWGAQPTPVQQQQQQQLAQPPMTQYQAPPKVLSLEEVEAQILASRQQQQPPPPPAQGYPQQRFPQEGFSQDNLIQPPPPQPYYPQGPGYMRPPPPNQQQQQQQQQYGFASSHEMHPQFAQVLQHQSELSEAEKQKLYKRSKKLANIAKYNGIMTLSNKNFVTRIQLQQLVTEDPYNEDFYHQVHSAIQARKNPQEPLSKFAETYLLPKAHDGRNLPRRIDPLHRMHQQVQRAVASAKAHPKSNQFEAEGALGKISFSSGKAPRKMLNIAPAASAENPAAGTGLTGSRKRRYILQAIENVYNALLDLEELERRPPPPAPVNDDTDEQEKDEDEEQQTAEEEEKKVDITKDERENWKLKHDTLIKRLWTELHVMEPVEEGQVQDFIAILSHAKGKKLIPRVFRFTTPDQHLTMLTMIIAHLETLDVVKKGYYGPGAESIAAPTREEIMLFLQAVMPPLLHYISEAPAHIVIGLTNILIDRNDVLFLNSTRIGLAFLTVLISRAELLKQEQSGLDAADAAAWERIFDGLFKRLKDHMDLAFPPQHTGDDSYVWQFLASLALAANINQQHMIVDEVRDKVFNVMAECNTLPRDVAVQKMANLNLFLNVMGLNAVGSEIRELQTES